jgi:microcystin-dependent protein
MSITLDGATGIITPQINAVNIIGETGITTPLITAVSIIGESEITTPQITAGNLVGSVCFFAMTTPPAGFLKANGATVSRTTYAALFSAIGTTFGAGDGSTTFTLPDLRGEFIRGWSDGSSVDSGRVFGSDQADLFKSHTHTQRAWGNGTSTGSFTSSTNEGTVRSAQPTDSTGGTETRPRNVALLACIKF